MISPESTLHAPGKMSMPAMPGLMNSGGDPNPFSGIRRAGQAKRAMNFEKWQGKDGASSAGANADKASFDGAKNHSFGGQAGTQVGAMRQAKF